MEMEIDLEKGEFTTLDGEMCPLEDRCEYGHHGSDNCCNKDYQNCKIYQDANPEIMTGIDFPFYIENQER